MNGKKKINTEKNGKSSMTWEHKKVYEWNRLVARRCTVPYAPDVYECYFFPSSQFEFILLKENGAVLMDYIKELTEQVVWDRDDVKKAYLIVLKNTLNSFAKNAFGTASFLLHANSCRTGWKKKPNAKQSC